MFPFRPIWVMHLFQNAVGLVVFSVSSVVARCGGDVRAAQRRHVASRGLYRQPHGDPTRHHGGRVDTVAWWSVEGRPAVHSQCLPVRTTARAPLCRPHQTVSLEPLLCCLHQLSRFVPDNTHLVVSRYILYPLTTPLLPYGYIL